MTGDRIDGLTRVERAERISQLYGHQPLTPAQVVDLIDQAVSHRQGLSLVRVGDVMADLVTGHLGAIQIWDFIGIPKPPPQPFMEALRLSLRRAGILGLTHRRPHAQWVAAYLRQNQISPPYVADSFVNDSLLADGAIHELIRRYKVGLVGRSADAAARKLAEQGLSVAATCPLDEWQDFAAARQALAASAWEVLLVGAGEPGRILCTELAQAKASVALDVGHVLDGLAHPTLWERGNKRLLFRRMYRPKQNPP